MILQIGNNGYFSFPFCTWGLGVNIMFSFYIGAIHHVAINEAVRAFNIF